MVSENEMNLMLVAGVILVLVVLIMRNKNEGLENVAPTCGAGRKTYNPRAFQPAIASDADDGNFIPLPNEVEKPWSRNTGNYGEADILDDGANGMLGLNFNMCSKNCCSAQYPPPFSVTPDDYLLMSGKEYVPTSYKCSNSWQDSGCLCLTKEQALNLNSRGSNAMVNV
jgi:hypothetical protein